MFKNYFSVPFDYSILLHPDPISPGRYFCSHKAGIHSVKVPIVSQIAEMALKGKYCLYFIF